MISRQRVITHFYSHGDGNYTPVLMLSLYVYIILCRVLCVTGVWHVHFILFYSDISVVFFRCLGCRACHQKVFTSCRPALISLLCFFRCSGCRASHQKVFTSCRPALISVMFFRCLGCRASHQKVFTSCRPALISLLCFSGVWGVGLATRKCSLHAINL